MDNFDFLSELDRAAAEAGTARDFYARAAAAAEAAWREGCRRPGLQVLSWMLRRSARLDSGADLLSALDAEVELADLDAAA